MQERLEEEQQQQQQQLLLQQQQQQHYSPRNLSAATSPIKDTVRGSQEFTKKLSTSYHGGAGGKAANSSNSSSSFGNIVKEKLGRRSRSSAKEEVNFKKKKKRSPKRFAKSRHYLCLNLQPMSPHHPAMARGDLLSSTGSAHEKGRCIPDQTFNKPSCRQTCKNGTTNLS